jgi:hypothetical protein
VACMVVVVLRVKVLPDVSVPPLPTLAGVISPLVELSRSLDLPPSRMA